MVAVSPPPERPGRDDRSTSVAARLTRYTSEVRDRLQDAVRRSDYRLAAGLASAAPRDITDRLAGPAGR